MRTESSFRNSGTDSPRVWMLKQIDHTPQMLYILQHQSGQHCVIYLFLSSREKIVLLLLCCWASQVWVGPTSVVPDRTDTTRLPHSLQISGGNTEATVALSRPAGESGSGSRPVASTLATPMDCSRSGPSSPDCAQEHWSKLLVCRAFFSILHCYHFDSEALPDAEIGQVAPTVALLCVLQKQPLGNPEVICSESTNPQKQERHHTTNSPASAGSQPCWYCPEVCVRVQHRVWELQETRIQKEEMRETHRNRDRSREDFCSTQITQRQVNSRWASGVKHRESEGLQAGQQPERRRATGTRVIRRRHIPSPLGEVKVPRWEV